MRRSRVARWIALTTTVLALVGASSASALTLSYNPGDYILLAVTVTDYAGANPGTVYRDATAQRVRTDTDLGGGAVRRDYVLYDKLFRYTVNPDGQCFRSDLLGEGDAGLVTGDDGLVVTDLGHGGTSPPPMDVEGETLERWNGSSLGESIVVGRGPVPGGVDTTVRYVETPAGSVFYKAPFVSGRPRPNFSLPANCGPTPFRAGSRGGGHHARRRRHLRAG